MADDQNAPVVLVTGATDGLGQQVSRDIAAGGASVVLHGRNRGRCEDTAAWVRGDTGNDRVDHHVGDFASLQDVRRLADEIRDHHERLDALVNNAGIGGGDRRTSADGYELQFAVNYLAHFLLTRRLLDLLRASAPARIVNVSSAAQTKIVFDDVMLERGYEPIRAYAQSKLAQTMFTFDLAEELAGTGVTATAVHPASLMPTKLAENSFGRSVSTLEEGADAVVRLVVSPELEGVNGWYFNGTQRAHADGQAYDPKARARLRELSQQLTG